MAHLEDGSNMQNAIDELDVPNLPSLHATAKKWDVKKSTLSDQRKGKKPRQQAQSTALNQLEQNGVERRGCARNDKIIGCPRCQYGFRHSKIALRAIFLTSPLSLTQWH